MTGLVMMVLTMAADPAPIIESVVGTGKKGYSGDNGPALQAELADPFYPLLDADGNLLFSDTGNHCIRRVDAKTGVISTILGSGEKGYGGDGGPATKATLNEPYGLALDSAGHLYVADRLNACVRKLDQKTGIVTTLTGTGQPGFAGDGGPAKNAQLREPNGLAYADGKLYIADVADQRIRVVDLKTGTITTFCGTGVKKTAGDGGPVKEATLAGPRAVAVGPRGNLYIVEREGNCVRKVEAGRVDRVAGTGKKGYSGDNGPAKEATFNGPKEIAIDAAGNLFIVDTENQAIRRIDARTGIITTVAGNGKRGGAGDGGPPTKAELGRPHGVAVAPDGALYIGDTLNHRIRRVKLR